MVNNTAFLIGLTIVAMLDLELDWADIKLAYVTCFLPEDHPVVLIKPPPGLDRSYGKYEVWEIHKALYGLEEAGRIFFLHLNKVLRNHGFKGSRIYDATYHMYGANVLPSKDDVSYKDNCVYNYLNMTSGSILYCATHVDDLIFGYNNKKLFKEIMDSIRKELTIGVLEKLETVI